MAEQSYMQQYVQELVRKARVAQAEYAEFDQKQLDKVARAAAKCVYDNAERLAIAAVEETHMGTVEGKTRKMKGAMTNQWAYTKGRVSKGVVGWEKGKLDKDCILKIAKPAGVVAGVMPVTNPTTTFGANAMQALKGGNAIVVCPHPRAKRVTKLCCDLIREAIVAAGAPADLVQTVEEPSIEVTNEVMRQCDLVVATGGPGMVKAANSSGNPSFGVGQGNCQVVIDKDMSDRFEEIAIDVVPNRAYDSGIPCTGEQTIILPADDMDAFCAALERHQGYIVRDEQAIARLRELLFIVDPETGDARPNAAYVGKDVQELGREIGLTIPDGVLSMFVPISKYGKDELLCKEKMCPVANLYGYDGDWKDAVHVAKTNLLMEGAGHSTDIYTKSQENQIYAGIEIPVCRLPVNCGQSMLNGRPYYSGGMASTSGLGCGFWQSNSLSGNLTFEHLLNYTRMLYKVEADRPDPTEEEIWAEDDKIL